MFIVRRFEFDAAHRVVGHSGKCKYLHGHHYVAEVTIQAKHLNLLGMVMDFGDIKSIIGGWIDRNWDHNIILNDADPLLELYPASLSYILQGREPFVMMGNPTAEMMADHLVTTIVELLRNYNLRMDGSCVRLQSVKVYETPNCWAVCDNHIN